MPLVKETVTLTFTEGLDTIDDPNQLPIGRFVNISNTVFIKDNSGLVGALKKRNGFLPLAQTTSTISFLTTYNNGLVGLGPGSIQQYSQSAQAWTNQGFFQPVTLSNLSLIKNSYSQYQQDAALSPNGIGCVAYASGNAASPYQYALFDSATGQFIQAPRPLNVIASTSQVIGLPRVYVLGSNFLIMYGTTGSAVSGLVMQPVGAFAPFTTPQPTAIGQNLFTSQISTTFAPNTFGSASGSFGVSLFDGVIASNSLFVSYIASSGIVGSIITPQLIISSATLAAGSFQSICIGNAFDSSRGVIYTAIGSGMSVSYLANNYNYSSVFAPQQAALSSLTINYSTIGNLKSQFVGITNVSGVAQNGVFNSYYDVTGYWSFGNQLPGTIFQPSPKYDNLVTRPVTQAGVIGSESIIGPSLGLGSKPFVMNGGTYVFGAFQNLNEPTYFLLNSSGYVISSFANGNGGGFYYGGVPNVSVLPNAAYVSYLRKDLIESQNSGIVGSNSSVSANPPFFTQTGINYASVSYSSSSISSRQSGNTMAIGAGFLWNYDGLNSFENNFFVYPEAYCSIISGPPFNFSVTQAYQYQILFESTDAQANIYQSTPAIGNNLPFGGPSSVSYISVVTTTPRLGYRLINNNPVKISVYRWSQANPVFTKLGSYVYTGQPTIGSVSVTPTLTVLQTNPFQGFPWAGDSIEFQDTTPDSAIIGNEVLYTNGNVVEDAPPPAFISTDIWDERLWGISAEDGSLWYSKPIVVDTPIEMNQAFSIYVPPIQTAQGTAQQPLCLAPLDEKQILFCKSAILYFSGTGPDITDANSGYSEPAQIPSQVGCSNQNSIVLTPYGIMFQSDNGIWLLGRDLSVLYIGKEVEAYNSSIVTSAVCVPGTSEVRFSLNTGQRLTYDMLAKQWTVFNGPAAIESDVIYQGLDTPLSTGGQVYQETIGSYLDDKVPVTMSFTTGWINLSGLQGYARAYWMNILGTFYSPHTYTMGIAYDYNPAIVQTATVNPYNVVGSGSVVEQWQIAFTRPQCQSFQLTFTEISSGSSGAGLTISGIGLTYGKKKSYPRNIPPKNRTT